MYIIQERYELTIKIYIYLMFLRLISLIYIFAYKENLLYLFAALFSDLISNLHCETAPKQAMKPSSSPI